MEAESHHEPIIGRCPPGFNYDEERDKCSGNEITNLNGNVCLCFFFPHVVIHVNCFVSG